MCTWLRYLLGPWGLSQHQSLACSQVRLDSHRLCIGFVDPADIYTQLKRFSWLLISLISFCHDCEPVGFFNFTSWRISLKIVFPMNLIQVFYWLFQETNITSLVFEMHWRCHGFFFGGGTQPPSAEIFGGGSAPQAPPVLALMYYY